MGFFWVKIYTFWRIFQLLWRFSKLCHRLEWICSIWHESVLQHEKLSYLCHRIVLMLPKDEAVLGRIHLFYWCFCSQNTMFNASSLLHLISPTPFETGVARNRQELCIWQGHRVPFLCPLVSWHRQCSKSSYQWQSQQ